MTPSLRRSLPSPPHPATDDLRVEVRRAVGTRSRRLLALVAVALGVAGAVTVTAAGPAAERTFSVTSTPAQLLISVLVPFFGVLLTADLVGGAGAGRQTPRVLRTRLLAAVVVAVIAALCGVVVSAATVAAYPSAAPGGRWQHLGAVVLGSVLVQVTAQLCGTGLGMLLRRRGVAMLGTIVLPLGLWLILGAVGTLRPAQAWLAPAVSAGHLLGGQMTSWNWAQWMVVVLLWGLALNVAGARRARGASGSAVS
jgi:hypothetical protein